MARAGGHSRRFSLLIAAGVVVLVGALYWAAPDFFKVVEFNLYDQHFRFRGPRSANPQVAIVTIDEASLRTVGRWPWSRTILADLVRRLVDGGAATIAFDVLFNEPEPGAERQVMDRSMHGGGRRNLDPKIRAELERMARENARAARLAEEGCARVVQELQ